VDHDPLVLVHAPGLLVGTPEGATDYVDADLREPDKILEQAARTLDLTQPTALVLLGILGHIADDDEARSIVDRLMGSLPSGSYLVHSDGASTSEKAVEAIQGYNESGAVPYNLRSPETLARFFDGLELVNPGVVDVTQWRPEPSPSGGRVPVQTLCGVARKP
jgi:O-methyltransferase involved in polyketide biosynthesis